MTRIDPDTLADLVTRHSRTDYSSIRLNQTVLQAIESLRTMQIAEKVVYFYVLDDANKLVGVVPTRRLLMSQPDARIAQIMVSLAFPVVDAENRLVGVVDVGLFTDEMFDVSEAQSNEDVFQLIGVHIAQGRRGSPLAGLKSRFPWLLCNIGGGMVCAFIAGLYDRLLGSQIILALFIPVVLTISEGVSIQSMTITVQGFRKERVDWKMIFRSLRSELLTALLLGICCGGAVAGVGWIWKRDQMVAAAIGFSILLAVVSACLLGIVLPAVVHRLRGNPRIASGPLVLAFADVATLLLYFNLAGLILR